MDKFDLEKAAQYYEEENNITKAAKQHCKDIGIEYSEKYRNRLSRFIRSDKYENVEDDNQPEEDFETKTETNQYDTKHPTLSAINPDTGEFMDIWTFCDYYKIPREHVKSYKQVNSQNGGIPTYNIASHAMKGEYFEEFYDNLLEQIEAIPNRPKSIIREVSNRKDAHLLIVDPADIHLGKLCDAFEVGETYNNQIAIQRALEGVKGILEKAEGFHIEEILFVGGNDILHIDTPKRTTTSGTPQDTEGMWYSNFLLAKQLYIDIINILLEKADVRFVYNPSNHDYTHGFFLADVIKTYFKDVDNITFDTSINHRKYYRYHNNLIGTTHGDSAKISDLPLLMADECEFWSECKNRYIYGHHVHHKTSKDYIGVTFETLRSPSGTDSWHHRNGYTGVPKAVEGFIHHRQFGQVARFTHIF